jgi:SET domain-containing protein
MDAMNTPTNLLKVGRSSIHGKGLFTRSAIGARRKLGELGGELISQREARRRARAADCIVIVEFNDKTAIDASDSKSPCRYINHSCSPNSFIRIFRKRVEFYTLRLLSPGEEITCNYGETHHNGTLKCRCSSTTCKGYI